MTFTVYDEFGDHALDSGIQRIIGPRTPFILDSVLAKNSKEEATAAFGKLQKGDKVIAFNGESTPYFIDFRRAIKSVEKPNVEVTVLRGADTLSYPMTLGCERSIGVAGKGISKYLDYAHYDYSFTESFPAGFNKAAGVLGSYVRQFKKVARHADSLGGFGALGSLFPESFSDDNYWQKFWNITALLSVILAFMNLLPIPALDGGHVMFLLYEMIFRRKPGEKFMEYAQMTGMILLLSLMLFANGNDLFRSLFGGDDEPTKDCWGNAVTEVVTPSVAPTKDTLEVVKSTSLTDTAASDSVRQDSL